MRKIKRVILFLTVAMMLLVFGSCNLVGSIYAENKGVVLAEEGNGNTIIYNGYTYHQRSGDWGRANRLICDEEKLVAYVWTGELFLKLAPIIVSDLDEEENLLDVQGLMFGRSGIYYKEGFVFPEDEENLPMETLYIEILTGLAIHPLVSFSEFKGLTLNELFEEEETITLYEDTYKYYYAYVGLQGWEYYKACNYSMIIELNGEIYWRGKRTDRLADGGVLYEGSRKVKAEYFDLIKNGLEKLDEIHASSAIEEE